MPSSVTFSAATANTKSASQSIYTRPPQKKQKMSITQTYFLAHSARGKLSREAARPDHDLRLLVGHANMLDSLMLDLANAEQEQERWFNNIVNGSQSEEEEEERHRHVETIVEEPEADWEPEDATSSEEESEDESEQKPDTKVTAIEVDSDMEDDDEENEDLTLVRTASRHSPPELSLDTDSDSEDEHMPPSPPTHTIEVLSEKQRQAIATTSFYDAKDNASLSPEESEAFEEEGFYLPSRQQPTIIAAY
ncbi:uncharacterized protein PV07_08564 [Cladophialophora immunda]|uniref:Uncharacterized protein n=1 Tax=Cladophialophora immunda TaxID=569365 RepID=A0A0D1ZCA8_9EURO|nr:uncharacterized protein PV07_08564 [Cladophialophora immunda]KIW25381.1 hypothetical protein PV07_08564 [Cladophialophora immunda]